MNSINDWLLPIDSNNPFCDTDLLVFKNKFKGQLPLNGIREREFKRISEYFISFANGEEKIRIVSDTSHGTFKNAFKLLLTRKVGREIINKVEGNSLEKVKIMIGPKSKADTTTKKATVSISLGQRKHYGTNCQGQKITIETNLVIAIGHEFAHLTHLKTIEEYKALLPTMDPKLDNLEEERTIWGHGKGREFDPLCENRLQAAFIMPFRRDHDCLRIFDEHASMSQRLEARIVDDVDGDIDELLTNQPELLKYKFENKLSLLQLAKKNNALRTQKVIRRHMQAIQRKK